MIIMIMLLKRTLGVMALITIGIVMLNALLWIGQQDYQEAQRQEARMENYDVMINNALEGNHHLNRAYLSHDGYDK